jgi:hypothetical protein
MAAQDTSGGVLLLRSISFQLLDLQWPRLTGRFAGQPVTILTHDHSLAEASGYPGVSRVIRYPGRGRFHWRMARQAVAGQHYRQLVVPLSTAGGGGQLNLVWAGLMLPADERWLLLPDGRLQRLDWAWPGRRLLRLAVARGLWLLLLPLILLLSLVVTLSLRRLLTVR